MIIIEIEYNLVDHIVLHLFLTAKIFEFKLNDYKIKIEKRLIYVEFSFKCYS